jgi:hypothetical protein
MPLPYSNQTTVASWEPGATTGLSDERAVFAHNLRAPQGRAVRAYLAV